MRQRYLLPKRILKTIKYFDILDMPVTAVQIWRYLAVEGDSGKEYSLGEIKKSLQVSGELKGEVESKWGYYFLRGKSNLVADRLHRHILAAQKWKITGRISKRLAYLPFVKMIAASGSLALNNTGQNSDLDLFIVARGGRIWTARLFLLLATQLTGRRRKYWDRRAPDKLCLNHYVSSDRLALGVNRNIYTAVLYACLTPLSGQDFYVDFMRNNQGWMREFVSFHDNPNLKSAHAVSSSGSVLFLSGLMENLLAEPLFDFMEKIAESIQRRAIVKHAGAGNEGRVFVSHHELAFHPGSKEREIVNKFRFRAIN